MTTNRPPLLAYLIAAALLVYTGWMVQGWRKDVTIERIQRDASKAREKAATDLAAAERRERDKERDGANLLTTRTNELKKEIADAQAEKTAFIAGVRRGDIRLSIPVASCTASGTAGTDPALDGRDRHQARADLTPAAASALETIAGDGDDAIRQLNACIDAYNDIRHRYNVQAQ